MSYVNPLDFSIDQLPTPFYVVDKRRLRKNGACLRDVARRSGAKILLAQKAFSMYPVYPLLAEYLDGTTASSLFEARLGSEEMPGTETHIFSPAYRPEDFSAVVHYCNHIVFNNFSQVERFAGEALAQKASLSLGLRLNPECQTQQTTPLYDPCAPYSRLGMTLEAFTAWLDKHGGCLPSELSGFHMHTLCEQNSDALKLSVAALENTFSPWLKEVSWLNLGGGHHITREDYDIETLIEEIIRLRARYDVEIYLEPGEAVALNAGYLVTSVLDFVENKKSIAILDASAECHMPDVLAMPYRPPLLGAEAEADAGPYRYRLASATCLAGDCVGDYSFRAPLKIGDRLVFADMAIYTMVKNNMFNGICLPSIATYDDGEGLRLIRRFDYEDFRGRLS